MAARRFGDSKDESKALAFFFVSVVRQSCRIRLSAPHSMSIVRSTCSSVRRACSMCDGMPAIAGDHGHGRLVAPRDTPVPLPGPKRDTRGYEDVVASQSADALRTSRWPL
jgi:hypothetical protein